MDGTDAETAGDCLRGGDLNGMVLAWGGRMCYSKVNEGTTAHKGLTCEYG